MTLWFGPFVDIRPDHGYFYLCPSCYRERIQPHLDEVHGRVADLYRRARELGLDVDPARDEGGPDAATPDDASDEAARATVPAGGGGGDG